MGLHRFLASILTTSLATFALQASFGAETMTVEGRELFTAAGEKVVLRGVNEMFVWSDDPQGDFIYPEIAKSGANVVRIVWTTQGDLSDFDASIANCLKNGMIPMVEMHDATGKIGKVEEVVDFWVRPETVAIIEKHRRWIILNIANEAGGNHTSDKVYLGTYADAISRIRKTGLTVPLVIDAPGWGQDETMILRTWETLRAADPLRNVMFSVHTYWVDKQQERLDALAETVVEKRIPFIFGEGPQQVGFDCKSEFPWRNLLAQCQENDIGWIAWSWGYHDNGDCHPGKFDMTQDGTFGNWENDWGRGLVVDDPNSIANTSVRPASLVKQAAP